MSLLFALGGAFFLGTLCAGAVWRVQNRRTRALFSLILAVPMVAMWQGAVMQASREPTVLAVIWAVIWSSPFWLAGILLCAWILPSKGSGKDDWHDRRRDERSK